MMKLPTPFVTAAFVFMLAALGAPAADMTPKHLFILSGQSNMENMRPQASFIPTVRKAFGASRVIVVKEAESRRGISGWVKDWAAKKGPIPEDNGDVYARLIKSVQKAIRKKQIQTVTFVWMQGERDAREGHGKIYKESLEKLLAQLKEDLGREDINLVIGRLSDHDLQNKRSPHWTRVRAAQTDFVREHSRAVLVNTDDLNDSLDYEGNEINNDIHLSEQGSTILGQRLAEAAISLIRNP